MSVGQECVNEVVSDVFRKPLDNRLIENEDLRQTCKDMRLTVTKNFKRQLEYLHYMLELHVRSKKEAFSPFISGSCSLYRVIDYIGFNTGNGEKLSYSQAAGLSWLSLAVA